MPERVATCGRCLRKPPPIDRVHAAFRYGFPVDRLLPRFKFHHDLAAGRELAEAMRAMLAGDLADAAARPGALIPVPLHPARLRERGYNQALEVARPLAKAFSIPLQHEALQRIRHIPPQSGLGALARRRNPRGAFAVSIESLPAHVALVDDVMTTGATLHECARVLKRAGVQRVDAWVAARVPLR
jgi:ComF family protein